MLSKTISLSQKISLIPKNISIVKNIRELALELNPQKMTALVAEDNFLIFMEQEYFLTNLGFKVLHANNGKEALKIATATNVDFVLMDIEMPDMNGFQATSAIKKIKPALPIIACTSHQKATITDKMQEAGMDSYSRKEIEETNLFNILNSFFSPQPIGAY